MLQTKFTEKIKRHILRLKISSSESRVIYEIMWTIWYSETGHRWQYDSAHALCVLDN